MTVAPTDVNKWRDMLDKLAEMSEIDDYVTCTFDFDIDDCLKLVLTADKDSNEVTAAICRK